MSASGSETMLASDWPAQTASTMPVVKAAWKRYRDTPNEPTLRLFEDRGHSLVFDQGRHEIADYCLSWLERERRRLT